MDELRYQRCELLFGDDYPKLRKAKILLLGVGGVGSFALDCLWRSGITDITIVDYDIYEITNQNRQIGSDALGELKVEHLGKLYPGITTIQRRIDAQWVEDFDFSSFDVVLDAVDDFKAKIALAIKVHEKLISSTGSAKRVDTSMMQVAPIFETHGDKYAYKIRNALRRANFEGSYTALFTPEAPRCLEKGSFVAVTGAFGLALCSEAVKRILNETSS